MKKKKPNTKVGPKNVWFRQVKLTKIYYIETLFKVWFIQNFDLLRV